MPTFKSTSHPGEHSPALVYARHVVPPLAGCMLPVMIATLIAILEGHRVLPYFVAGFFGALLIATLWTHFHLRRMPAAVHVRASTAAVQTVWDVLRARPPAGWQPVYDLRARPGGLTVTIGYVTYALNDADWPHHQELSDALQDAHRATFRHRASVQEACPDAS